MGTVSGLRRGYRYKQGEQLPAWQLQGDYSHWDRRLDPRKKEFCDTNLTESAIIPYKMKLSAETANHLEDLLHLLTYGYEWGHSEAWTLLFTSLLEILRQEASGKSLNQVVLQWPSDIKLGGYLDYQAPKLGTKGVPGGKTFDCWFFLSEKASIAVNDLYKSNLNPKLASWDRKISYAFSKLSLWLGQNGLHLKTRSVYHVMNREIYYWKHLLTATGAPQPKKVEFTVRLRNGTLYIPTTLLKAWERKNGGPIKGFEYDDHDQSHGKRPHFLRLKVCAPLLLRMRGWIFPKKVGGKVTDKERPVAIGAIIDYIGSTTSLTKKDPYVQGKFPVEWSPVAKTITIQFDSPL